MTDCSDLLTDTQTMDLRKKIVISYLSIVICQIVICQSLPNCLLCLRQPGCEATGLPRIRHFEPRNACPAMILFLCGPRRLCVLCV